MGAAAHATASAGPLTGLWTNGRDVSYQRKTAGPVQSSFEELTDFPGFSETLAQTRLEFASRFIDDTRYLRSLVKPGRLIVVDLRDEFIEKE